MSDPHLLESSGCGGPGGRQRTAPFRIWLAWLVAASLSLIHTLAAASGMIHPGIVLDPAEDTVYAADRAGRVHALSLSDGETVWRTSVPGLPLGMVDRTLIALGVPEDRGEVVVLALDPASGEILHQERAAVDPDVVAQFMPLPRRQFEVHAAAVAEGLEILWLHRRQPLRGALLADEDGHPIVESPRSREQHGRLLVRVTAQGLDVTLDAAAAAPVPFAARAPEPAERIAGPDGAQWYASDDGAIAVVSEARHPAFGTVHRFDIRTREGESLGTFDSPYAWVPFATRAGLALYRIDPVMTDLPGEGRVTHGSRLIAHDFATGQPRWSFEALERRYFGPQPP